MKNLKFRPMLGYTDVPSDGCLKLWFDEGNYFYASPKYDGIRCLITPDGPRTRRLKLIPNNFVDKVLNTFAPLYCDGELITPSGDFHEAQSAIMSIDGQPDFRYMVFDSFRNPDHTFAERQVELDKAMCHPYSYVFRVEHEIISDFATLQSYEEKCLDEGYEGVILRHPYRPYKFGRSTLGEMGMLKIKRFVDDEAEIIGFEELMVNDAAPEQNALGLQERKKRINQQTPGNTLGALIVYHPKFGEFRIGTGWTAAYAKNVWENKIFFLHKIVTFIYQPHGIKDKPRCPRFKSIRLD